MDLEGLTNESSKKGCDTKDLISVVNELSPFYQGPKEDLKFLETFLHSSEFQQLMKIHSKVQDVPPRDKPNQSLTILHMVLYDLEETYSSDAVCAELYKCLNSVHVHSAIMAYDKILNKDYAPIPIHPGDYKKQEEKDPIITVRVDKEDNEPLGITVKSDSNDNVIISRIIHGKVADRCGILRVGDIIHEINGYSVYGKTIDDIADEMSKLSGTIVFKISSPQEYRLPQPVTYVKALFSYNPDTDADLPCAEAGLLFNKGDILAILNKDDPHWWQAKVYDTAKVGLIPSTKTRERFEYRSTLTMKDTDKRIKRRKPTEVEYSPLNCEIQGGHELATYEEVVKMKPLTLHPRPLILIAPTCHPFSMSEVKFKLIQSDRDKYGQAIMSTTRPPKENEINGRHYHFVQKEEFLRSLQSKQMLDHMEYAGQHIGLSINTIRTVMTSGKTCVLTLSPKTLKIVHYIAELKPYVIFFAAPRRSNAWLNVGLVQEQKDIKRAQQESDEMEARYGQYFDKTIEYVNVEQAFIATQRTVAEELLSKPQWVPSVWSA
ncbi:PREDICTED: MAGUK p55 subfamily member 6-like isoform X2 [Amphimedon queenslandica]|uniref:MAGUK p55 subfamily member 7 n=1 Tax=Amphimedon queenslandica TaxID=400682 RepID=A0AAN0JCT0_AMPQE|nr:PREDICTED: MAGUK p55 subfamily member 6-like isoform X2 [Amphimedon queenslandica]|eukprot:XP_019854587.1 PREDICTED: MAGUK p55 subfamily member 6-like isoform X2 [Amphimedon queenslandica]